MANHEGLIDFESEERENVNADLESYDDGDTTEPEISDKDLHVLLEEGDYADSEEDSDEEETDADPDHQEPEHQEQTEEQQAQDFKNEENARNAERRRLQQQQQALEQYRSQLPEAQLARQLEQYYGVPAEQLIQRIQMANIQKEAQERGVTPEFIERERQRDMQVQQLQNQLMELNFQAFEGRIQNEMQSLQQTYPMLTQQDLLEAKRYMLNDLQNTEMPLEDAVLAKFGRKIIEGQRSAARNEALAQASGRTASSTLPPSTGKSTETPILTEAEKAAARVLGVSEKDYLKYKK